MKLTVYALIYSAIIVIADLPIWLHFISAVAILTDIYTTLKEPS